MAFKRVQAIAEGNYIVKITGAKVVDYDNGIQGIQLTVITQEGVYGNFLIFTTNIHLIEKLIKITYSECNEDEVNEQDFVNIEMEIKTKERNGYINIVDIIDINSEN